MEASEANAVWCAFDPVNHNVADPLLGRQNELRVQLLN